MTKTYSQKQMDSAKKREHKKGYDLGFAQGNLGVDCIPPHPESYYRVVVDEHKPFKVVASGGCGSGMINKYPNGCGMQDVEEDVVESANQIKGWKKWEQFDFDWTVALLVVACVGAILMMIF